MKKIISAGIQISIEPNAIKKNIDKCLEWYNRCIKETNAKFVVFPETVTTGFSPGLPLADFYKILPNNIDEILAPFFKMAKQTKSYCVVLTYEKTSKKNVIYNSAFFVGSNEKIIGVYRKSHPFPTERLRKEKNNILGWTTPGYDAPVFDTEFGKVGIIICYDGDFPELSRALAAQGAVIIARPSALLRSFEIWDLTNRARAYDNHIYMIAVNMVGADAANNYYFGHSMIISPIAQKLAQARGCEEIIYAELDNDPIKRVTYGANSPMLFDHLQDRNLKLYKKYILKEAQSPFEPAMRIPY